MEKGSKERPNETGAIGGLPRGMKFDPKQGTLLEVFINDVGLYLIKVMKPGAFAVVFSKDFLIKLAKAIYIPSINA